MAEPKVEREKLEDGLLTPLQAAEYLGVSVSSVKHWVIHREIKYTKIKTAVRFRKQWLDELIEDNTREVKRS